MHRSSRNPRLRFLHPFSQRLSCERALSPPSFPALRAPSATSLCEALALSAPDARALFDAPFGVGALPLHVDVAFDARALFHGALLRAFSALFPSRDPFRAVFGAPAPCGALFRAPVLVTETCCGCDDADLGIWIGTSSCDPENAIGTGGSDLGNENGSGVCVIEDGQSLRSLLKCKNKLILEPK